MSDFTVLAEGLAFPEGPAVAADGAIWVSELSGGSIVRIDEDGSLTRFATGGAPNGLAHAPDGSVWFCDQAMNEIRRLDPASGDLASVVDRIDDEALAAPNDLAFAPDGSLVFTCPGQSRDVPTGCVCRRDGTGVVSRIATGLLFPNGICFSTDGAQVLVAETYGACVRAGRWCPGSTLALESLFGTPGPIGADGIAMTSAGTIATTVHGAGMIRLYDPAWAETRDIAVPDARPAGLASDPRRRWSLIVTGTERGIVLGLRP